MNRMRMETGRCRNRHIGGMSLVELMVGLTVALIGLLVISGVLSAFSGQKRTTVSSSDAQVAGAVGTFMIERDLRMAGFGMNSEPLLGCMIHWFDSDNGGDQLPYLMVPVIIAAGVNGSDQITITYGNSDNGWFYTSLMKPGGGAGGPACPYAAGQTQTYNGSGAEYTVSSRYGFNDGDIVIVAEDAADSDGDGVRDCSVGEVTGVKGASNEVIHNPGGTSKYNKPGGLGIPYCQSAQLYNIGQLPESVVYALDAGNNLTLRSRQTGNVAVGIGEHIVMLRAMYCKDTSAPADGSIDTCDANQPANTAAWRQVIAVRFGVVARSPYREAAIVSDETLQVWPDMTLPSGAVIAGPTMMLSEEQRHYRYRAYQTLVPLRNMIWQVPTS
ncbi:MAG: PilW family protein [Rhodocyclaceae bacterium]|nr:PilW family protein [Rhodocyclaceae bacterium]